jgi:hypothetical protein
MTDDDRPVLYYWPGLPGAVSSCAGIFRHYPELDVADALDTARG